MTNVTDFSKEISYASKVVANQWPGVIQADDVEQEIYLRLLETSGSVEKLATMTSEERRNSLVHVGHQIGSRYKNDYELFSGNCYYGTEHVRAILDRKSTRLNSSHVRTSYAVFCLKKKTTNR